MSMIPVFYAESTDESNLENTPHEITENSWTEMLVFSLDLFQISENNSFLCESRCFGNVVEDPKVYNLKHRAYMAVWKNAPNVHDLLFVRRCRLRNKYLNGRKYTNMEYQE